MWIEIKEGRDHEVKKDSKFCENVLKALKYNFFSEKNVEDHEKENLVQNKKK